MSEAFNSRIHTLYQAALAEHRMLRDLKHRKLCRGTLDGVDYVIKAYRQNIWHRLFGLRPASTKGIQLLENLTPPVVADFVKEGWQLVVTRDCGGPDLFRRDKAEGEDLPAAFKAAGELLAKIHLRGLYHRDTKSPNFVINHALNDLPAVVIVDCDEVRSYGILSEAHIAFNLAQLLSCYVLYEEAELMQLLLIVLEAYRVTRGLAVEQMKRLMQEAVDIALRNHLVEVRVTREFLQRLREYFG